MSLDSRRELIATLSRRYHSAGKAEKHTILNELVKTCDYHRKYAIYVLNKAWLSPPGSPLIRVPRERRRKYGPDVSHAFKSVWLLSGGLCPKRLVPFLSEFVDVLERFDELSLCPDVRDKMLCMSVATAERLLSRECRSRERGIGTTLPGTLLRQQIPIRTYEDWSDQRPGFFEIDLVAHCGGTSAGDYVYTLTMTDIYTGWTECVALVNRSQQKVVEGIELIRKRLPFSLLGVDSDNGSEFINHLLKNYCDQRDITFTRCRPYKKNDQCHVEQKNGAVVRPLVGYARYEGAAAAAYLNQLYAIHRLCVNFFEPSMKLIGKSRNGSRVTKTYDSAKTPWQRLQSASVLSAADQVRLTSQYRSLNPAKLRRRLQEIEMGLRRFTVVDFIVNSGPQAVALTTGGVKVG